MKIVLTTERLKLREMVQEDLDFVAGMLGHPEVMRYYPKVYSRGESEEWLQRQLTRYARDGHGLWLVQDKAGEPIGQVGLISQDVNGVLEPEIGYLIHYPYWRRHYASEAALGVRRYAFETKGLHRVISLVRPENVPSQGVARKLGMTVRREVMFKGYRHFVFEVTKQEAESQNGPSG